MKKWFTAAALSSSLLIALSGCGTSTASNTQNQSGAGQASSTAKNELVIANAEPDPGSWDPIKTFLVAWGEIGNNIFDGLVSRDPDLKIGPGLATSWKYTNPTTLEFTLRSGVTFQDGEPFNANAVKFTFDRLLKDKSSPQYSNYNSIKSVQVVDDTHVIFHLNQVDPVLITKLAGYGADIVPPKYIQKHGDTYFGDHPIGTGPYKVTSYKKNNSLTLEANESYWGGAPKIKKVLIRWIPDATTRLEEMQAGHVDIVETVPPSQVSTVKNDSSFTLETAGAPTVEAIRFDTSKSPVNNKLVRQAINYAIDKNALIQKVLSGYGKPISTFQGDISFGNDPSLKGYSYDPNKAKALLQQAGVKPGTTLTFDYIGSDSTFAEIAQAVSEELQQVGLNVKLQPVDQNTFYSDLIPHQNAGQMYEQGWGGWTLDFDNTAYLLYHKGEFWNPDYSNPQVEQLLTAERSTNDQAKRLEIFHQLDKVLIDQAVDVPLYQEDTIWAVSKNVSGWVTPPDERLDLKDLSFK